MLPVIADLDGLLQEVRASSSRLHAVSHRPVGYCRPQFGHHDRKLSNGLTIEWGSSRSSSAWRSARGWCCGCGSAGHLPGGVAGAVLWWLGDGLQFASVVALTVAFGLGLTPPSTISTVSGSRIGPARIRARRRRATVLVGPALILTSLVLACGLAVTVFSDLPSLRLFGWLAAFTLVAALVGDLFILRPTAMWLINLQQKLTGRSTLVKGGD